MRYCNQCHHVTLGDPLFCTVCGASYNARICPRRHVNVRSAVFCARCGSKELSDPAPPIPRRVILALWLAYAYAVLLLGLISALVAGSLLSWVEVGLVLPLRVVLVCCAVALAWPFLIGASVLLRQLLWGPGQARPKGRGYIP
jgi:hypothetical protein